MTDEKRSRVLGMILGSVSRGKFPQREPVAFLYNGVRLPKLPEWDKTVYPYAVMFKSIYNEYYTLRVSRSPCVVTCSVLMLGLKHDNLYWDGNNPFLEFRDSVEQFGGPYVEGMQNLDDTSFVWSNHDIFYADDYQSGYNDGFPVETPDPLAGTLYLKANEPIPVYE